MCSLSAKLHFIFRRSLKNPTRKMPSVTQFFQVLHTYMYGCSIAIDAYVMFLLSPSLARSFANALAYYTRTPRNRSLVFSYHHSSQAYKRRIHTRVQRLNVAGKSILLVARVTSVAEAQQK